MSKQHMEPVSVGVCTPQYIEAIDEPTRHDVDSDTWRKARARAQVLQSLIAQGPVTDEAAEHLAHQWQVSRATVRRRIKRFLQAGNLTAFLPRRSGRKTGARMLDPGADEVIRNVARKWWRRTENATIAEIEPGVVRECIALQLSPPSRVSMSAFLVQSVSN